ncbi:MAG: hypothetical protein ACRD4Y_15755, partial [Candidatus Acidiferrales bacterium]
EWRNMPPDPQMDKPQESAPAAHGGYETRDANVKGVYTFLVILGVTLVGTAIVCWGMFRIFSSYYGVAEPASAPFVDSRQVPMSPQLQVNPRQDLLRYREEQERSLEGLSWVNQSSGTVQIPIEQAMDLLVKKGLPVQGEAPPAAAAPEAKSEKEGGKKP